MKEHMKIKNIARMLIEEYIWSRQNFYIIIVWVLGNTNIMCHI